jgi:hypothetical protein
VKNFAKSIICSALILDSAFGQIKPTKTTEILIGELCGQLLNVDSRVSKGQGGTVENTSRLFDVNLTVYRRDNRDCCEGLRVVQKANTDTDGNFRFANLRPGRYWLVAAISGRQYKSAFRMKPRNSKNSSCQYQKFEINDSGGFRILEMLGPM